MADRRMFNQRIVESDAFTEMPATAQMLYIHLSMAADDDGFVNSPKKTARSVGCSEEDLDILLSKRFLLGFPSGVVVIKHWKMNNTIKTDRYKPTEYQEEFSQLYLKANKSYTDNPEHAENSEPEPERIQSGSNLDPNWIQTGSTLEPQSRLDKNSIDKHSLEKDKIERDAHARARETFIPPTLEEVTEFCKSRGSPVDPVKFHEYFSVGNWMDGKGYPVKNWKQKLISWEGSEAERNGRKSAAGKPVSGKVPKDEPRSEWGASEYKYD